MQNFKKNFKYYFVGLLFLTMIFVWYAVFEEDRDGLLVAFLNVGQGDAIFIQAPNGNQILLDGGSNSMALREISKIMPFYDRSIDVIIESHPDSDHIGGLVEVFKKYKTDLVLESGIESNNAAYQEIKKIIKEKNIQRIFLQRGMKINLDKGLYLNIFFPDRDVFGLDSNDASVVAKLVYNKTSFLFTGDSSDKIEKYLTYLDGEKLKSNFLKVAHHGSRTSTSEIFIGYVNPEYAIISVGKDNRYGHPHQEILDRLNQFQISILRTDEKGTIKIKSNGLDKILIQPFNSIY